MLFNINKRLFKKTISKKLVRNIKYFIFLKILNPKRFSNIKIKNTLTNKHIRKLELKSVNQCNFKTSYKNLYIEILIIVQTKNLLKILSLYDKYFHYDKEN